MPSAAHVLFIHQNFPAQFRHIAPKLAEIGWQCTFLTTNKQATEIPGAKGKMRVFRRRPGAARVEMKHESSRRRNNRTPPRNAYGSPEAGRRPTKKLAASPFRSPS